MLGKGVGPMVSVHVSVISRPKESSRSFMLAMFVLSSLIFTWTFFLDKLCTSHERVEVSEYGRDTYILSVP